MLLSEFSPSMPTSLLALLIRGPQPHSINVFRALHRRELRFGELVLPRAFCKT